MNIVLCSLLNTATPVDVASWIENQSKWGSTGRHPYHANGEGPSQDTKDVIATNIQLP